MKATTLIVSAMLTASLFTPAFGQDAGPRPGRRSPQRAPAPEIDPATDEVLVHIKGVVEPTEEQWNKIVEQYKAFRLEQRQAMRSVMRPTTQRSREPGQRREGADSGARQRPDRAAMMERVSKAIEAINAAFLRDAKALLRENQYELWESCIADLDLTPTFGRGRPGGAGAMLDPAKGPAQGDKAPAFELKDIHGESVSLESLLGKPVVIEFGSYTCPIFRRKVEAIENLRQEFGDRVNWVLIYTREAHPTDGWAIDINARSGIELAQHTSIEDRFKCALLCNEKMKLDITVLVDGFDDKVTKAYSGHPNRGYILNAKGVVVSRQVWIDPKQTGKELRSLLNPMLDGEL